MSQKPSRRARSNSASPRRLAGAISAYQNHTIVAHGGLGNLTSNDLHFTSGPDTYIFPLGVALQDYARNVSQNAFRNVMILKRPEEAAGKADGILIPRAVKADESHGIFTTSERRMTLVVEWTLKDRDNQKIVWVDTIIADAGRTMGTVFSYSREERGLFQDLFNDLSAKTAIAFEESAEVKRLGSSLHLEQESAAAPSSTAAAAHR